MQFERNVDTCLMQTHITKGEVLVTGVTGFGDGDDDGVRGGLADATVIAAPCACGFRGGKTRVFGLLSEKIGFEFMRHVVELEITIEDVN